jgi:magnesium transporter
VAALCDHSAKDTMMIIAYALDCGRLHPVNMRTVDEDAAGTMPGAVWLDLEKPDAPDYAAAARATGLTLPAPDDITEIEASSRLVSDGDVLTMTLPIVSRADGALTASAAAFVLSPQRLVTIRLAPSLVIANFATQPHTIGPCPPASLFAALLDAMVERQADSLEELRHGLDTLSHQVFRTRFAGGKADTSIRGRDTEAALQRVLTTLGRDYDTITFLRDSQLGIARICGFAGSSAEWLPPAVKMRLASLERDIASLNEFSTHLTDKVQFLLDTTLGLINIAQNSLIKVLTIVSIVGIPPTLIAGIYGMNFKNIPELNWTYGYAYAWALMIASSVLPLLWFRKKGWV